MFSFLLTLPIFLVKLPSKCWKIVCKNSVVDENVVKCSFVQNRKTPKKKAKAITHFFFEITITLLINNILGWQYIISFSKGFRTFFFCIILFICITKIKELAGRLLINTNCILMQNNGFDKWENETTLHYFGIWLDKASFLHKPHTPLKIYLNGLIL